MEATVGFVVWSNGNATYAFADKVPVHPVIDWVGGHLIIRGVLTGVTDIYNLEDRWVAADLSQIKELLKKELEPVRLTDRMAVRRQARRNNSDYVRAIDDSVILLPSPTIAAYATVHSLFGNGQPTLLTASAIVAATCKVQVEPISLDLLTIEELLHCVENSLSLPQRRTNNRRVVDEEFLRKIGIGTAEPDF